MELGKFIAELMYQYFRKDCGPFGGEDPERVDDNTICLYSQSGDFYYTFNDDMSVDFSMGDDAIRNYINEMGGDVNEDDFERHYDNVLDLIGSDDDSWFYYFDTTMSIDKLLKRIKKYNKENK